MLEGIPLFSEQASNHAPEVDSLYFFITAVTAFVAVVVVVFVIVFAVKDRDKTGEKVGSPLTGSIPLEIGWSIIPFLISMVIFAWATIVFFHRVRAPDEGGRDPRAIRLDLVHGDEDRRVPPDRQRRRHGAW